MKQDEVKRLIEAMPQPDQFSRLAAFFGLAVDASGLEVGQAMAAFVHHARVAGCDGWVKLALESEDLGGAGIGGKVGGTVH